MQWLQDYGLIFDAVICVLLVTAIGSAIALNRRLAVLRSARGEMEKLVADFAAATRQAEGGLKALKPGSGEAAPGLATHDGTENVRASVRERGWKKGEISVMA